MEQKKMCQNKAKWGEGPGETFVEPKYIKV